MHKYTHPLWLASSISLLCIIIPSPTQAQIAPDATLGQESSVVTPNLVINGIPSESEFEAEINDSRVYDPTTRRSLFLFFRELCHLAVLLTDTLSLLYGHHGLSMPYLTNDDCL